MFKFIVVIAFIAVIDAQISGGFVNRPDLLQSSLTESLVKLSLTELANGQNLRATPVNIVSVGTQLVNGINYQIVFVARASSSNSLLTCTTRVYQTFSGTQSVTSVKCV
jgi:hypothetical protein